MSPLLGPVEVGEGCWGGRDGDPGLPRDRRSVDCDHGEDLRSHPQWWGSVLRAGRWGAVSASTAWRGM